MKRKDLFSLHIEWIKGGVCAPMGFKASGVHCGIRHNPGKKDLALVVSDVPANAAAVFTRNKVYGAPITVSREHLKKTGGKARAYLCNSGNANTCNADGVDVADAMCASLANAAGISAEDVIIASTGVIGQPIPLDAIKLGIPSLVSQLRRDGADDAAYAIMTTDTFDKQAAVTFDVSGKAVTIGAMCKGSGMIAPNMATMLAFVTTDAAIEIPALQTALTAAVNDSFNCVVIDGDTSTNDTCAIMANGLAGNDTITAESDASSAFTDALTALLKKLARELAKDGEGATRLLTVNLKGAPTDKLARSIARSIVTSPLCKTAIFGADANWGRVLCAIGYTEGEFAADTIDVSIESAKGTLNVCKNGMGVSFDEAAAKAILLEDEVTLNVNMNQGAASAVFYGCDLTYDYVKINGDYRS
ncbi:MAG: bifunctional glutamate N-acetyltransferase/amino-acid acetyltransferase ArgJ [Oscillospiraceae bacterium]|jgi:glutamate N-acetyltransferase/amino-acid N-acetyltransferase|nr:bifunctional glutamate N-acetyltransferase/amino-acid acetyltransferase ArgJ [Oscillospiraceae bacterium]